LGYLDSDEKISAAYSSADIFILPSLEDNLPNTMLEAMSCGTPVVAFDVGGMSDVIVNGVTGQLVPMGDIKEMGKAILSLIFNFEKRDSMGNKCRKKIEEEFSLHFQAGRYSKLYKDLMKHCNCSIQPRTAEITLKSWDSLASRAVESHDSPLYISLGPNFKAVYDHVLLKALTELTPQLYIKLKASEADREARLDALRHYEETFEWYEKQLLQVQEELKLSNADREARLKVINRLMEQIRVLEEERMNMLQTLHGQEQILAGSLIGLMRHRRKVKISWRDTNIDDGARNNEC